MEIEKGKQIELSDLKDQSFDLMFLAVNHELRRYALLDSLSSVNCNVSKIIAFHYREIDESRSNIFYIKPNVYDLDELNQIFETQFKNITNNDQISILVDYSCMTKIFYYGLILFISNKLKSFKVINVVFSYTPAVFEPPKIPKYNSNIDPLPGTYKIPKNKPTALIVCLGYEEKKAEGIIDYLDPKETFIFYSSPTLDEHFETQLLKSNEALLKKNFKTYKFPFDDLVYLEYSLSTLYEELKDDYNIIIAPLGPKPFTMVSMLLSIKYKEIDIWKVSSGSDINIYEQKPITNSFIINTVRFVC